MLIDPVLYQDDSKITGIRLTFFRDSKRIEGTDIKITARNLDEESKNPKSPTKKKSDSAKKDAAEVDKFYNGDEDEKSGKDDENSDVNKQSQKKDVPRLSQKETDALLGLDTVPDKKK